MNLIPRDNLFDLDNFFSGFHGLVPNVETTTESFFAPRADIHNKPNKYVINAELPGVKKEDLKVNFENGVLSIQAEMKDKTQEEDDGKVIRRERRFGKFSRSFYLGDDIDDSDIEASFKDGLLSLDIPKKKPVEPEKRQIEIK